MSSSSSSSSTPVSIVIVGGGLGGLVLARVLQVRNPNKRIHVTVLETDASAHARKQGGELDIHDDSGQIAIQAAGLLKEFAHIARPEAETTRVADKHGVAQLERTPPHVPSIEEVATTKERNEAAGLILPGRPECDRGQLRKMLIDSLLPETIRWGSKVIKLEPPSAENTRGRLTLTTGETIEADLIVGADGAWSKTRALVSSAQTEYCGMSFVELVVENVDKYPEISKLFGGGMLLALAPGQGMLGHRTGLGHVNAYAAVTVPQEWAKSGVDWNDSAAAKKELLTKYADWAPVYHDLIKAAVDSPGPIARNLYTLPAGHKWAHKTGVTLLGDAAHAMAPNGDGANMAMQDGADLATGISDALDALEKSDPSASTSTMLTAVDSAVLAFETLMFDRTTNSATEALEMLRVMFAADTPQGMIDFFKKHIAERINAAAAKEAGQQTQ